MTETEELIRRILKSLTPKFIRVLDRLGLSDAGIAEELHCKPRTISQDLTRIYSAFRIGIDFEARNRNKRSTLMEVWPRIRKQYQAEITEILERHRAKPVSKQGS